MFGVYWTSFNVADDICVYARLVYCFLGLGLHLLHPLVHAVEVSKGPAKELGG